MRDAAVAKDLRTRKGLHKHPKEGFCSFILAHVMVTCERMARPSKFSDVKPARVSVILHPDILIRIKRAAARAEQTIGDWLSSAAELKLKKEKRCS